MLNEKLEIFIVTYNRKKYLQETLDQLLSAESPIKNLDITVLDNASTDKTPELLNEYCRKYPNLKHIRHSRNIGGNANIARAFEKASKEYVWILCDDDEYQWNNWNEVEKAIKNGYDAIVVANYVHPKENLGKLLKQMTFTPSTIYKTSNLNTTVMVNIEYCISTMFPHLAVACSIINDPKKKIYICDNWFVNMVPHGGIETYVRGLEKSEAHPYMANMFWSVGYINTIQMIHNPDKKEIILDNMCEDLRNTEWRHNMKVMKQINVQGYNSYPKNYMDILCGLPKKKRISFLCFLIKSDIIKLIKNPGELKLKIFGIKIRLWSKKWIYIYKSGNHYSLKIANKFKTKIWPMIKIKKKK